MKPELDLREGIRYGVFVVFQPKAGKQPVKLFNLWGTDLTQGRFSAQAHALSHPGLCRGAFPAAEIGCAKKRESKLSAMLAGAPPDAWFRASIQDLN